MWNLSGSTFRQDGEDRSKYGTKLLDNLAKEINSREPTARNLKLHRQFYLDYTTLSEVRNANQFGSSSILMKCDC